MDRPLTPLNPLTPLALAAGLTLAGSLGVVALTRRDRPLHAHGVSRRATLVVDRPAGLGVPLLDTAATTECVIRTSRAASLVAVGPDVAGLAVRVPGASGHADLLFASTGLGVVGRYTLRLRRSADSGPLTTLLPMQTATGPVQIALLPAGTERWHLAWSRPTTRTWVTVGRLEAHGTRPDPGHFDPIGHPPAGLWPPPWVRALRAPAYRVARTLIPIPAARGRRSSP